jgi:transcriptional regulator with XRE-family HTH domain
MSQLDLARTAGVSEGLIAQIETAKRQPGLVNALAIAKALGVPLTAIGQVFVTAAELAEVDEPVDAA